MSEKPRPIYSSLADDPGITDVLDAFVVSLAERVDELQDAEVHNDLQQLGALAGRLASESHRLGFEALARCASVVESQAAEADARGAHKGLVDLTEVARRVRLGHRGAV